MAFVRLVARQVHPLSRQQYEALMLYGEGLRYREIAERMGLAYKTVCRHMEETRMKLGVKSAAEAYRMVRRMSRDS